MYWNSLNAALRRQYGTKVYKLALSSGCTCPNRDGTLGSRGCAYWEDGDIRYAPAIDEFRAVDTTGAGDNFLSGVIYGLLQDRPLGECVRLGNIIAGQSTTAMGCFGTAITQSLIRKYL